MIKLSLLIIIAGIVIISVLQVFHLFSTNTKIITVFSGVVDNLSSIPINEIEDRLPSLFLLQQIAADSLPEDFYENLTIKKINGKLQLASEYQATIWILGEPQLIYVSDGIDAEQNISLIEEMRQKARFDFYFSPYAETP